MAERVDVKVGFSCNNRCRFCVQGDKRHRYADRDTETAKRLLTEARRESIDTILALDEQRGQVDRHQPVHADADCLLGADAGLSGPRLDGHLAPSNGGGHVPRLCQVCVHSDDGTRILPAQCALHDVLLPGFCHPWRLLAQQFWKPDESWLYQSDQK